MSHDILININFPSHIRPGQREARRMATLALTSHYVKAQSGGRGTQKLGIYFQKCNKNEGRVLATVNTAHYYIPRPALARTAALHLFNLVFLPSADSGRRNICEKWKVRRKTCARRDETRRAATENEKRDTENGKRKMGNGW